MISLLRKKSGFLVLFYIIIALALLTGRNMVKAAQMYRLEQYEIITLDGLTIGLRSTQELDGSVLKLADVFSINEDCVDYAVNGVFKIPEEIKEVVIQKAVNTVSGYNRYLRCGIMNVEKITILSEKAQIHPRIASEDNIDYWEISSLDANRLETVDIKSQDIILLGELFYGCESLKEVRFEPDATLEIKRGAFTKCPNLKSLILPSGTSYCEGAIIEGSLENISFAKPSSKYGVTDGCIISKKGKRLLYVPPTVTKFTVP